MEKSDDTWIIESIKKYIKDNKHSVDKYLESNIPPSDATLEKLKELIKNIDLSDLSSCSRQAFFMSPNDYGNQEGRLLAEKKNNIDFLEKHFICTLTMFVDKRIDRDKTKLLVIEDYKTKLCKLLEEANNEILRYWGKQIGVWNKENIECKASKDDKRKLVLQNKNMERNRKKQERIKYVAVIVNEKLKINPNLSSKSLAENIQKVDTHRNEIKRLSGKDIKLSTLIQDIKEIRQLIKK